MKKNEANDFEIPAELRLKYIGRRAEDLRILREAVAAGSWEEFRRIGHQLRGNASSYGFPDLERIGILFEQAVDAKDFSAATEQLAAFEKWHQKASSA